MSVFDLDDRGQKVALDAANGIRFNEAPPWWEEWVPYSPLLAMALAVGAWVFFNRKQLFSKERHPRAILGTLRSTLTRPLITPVKRAGAVMLMFGLCLSAAGVAQVSSYHSAYERWMDAVVFGRWWADFWAVPAGAYLTFVGFILAYCYEATFGRVINWVRNG